MELNIYYRSSLYLGFKVSGTEKTQEIISFENVWKFKINTNAKRIKDVCRKWRTVLPKREYLAVLRESKANRKILFGNTWFFSPFFLSFSFSVSLCLFLPLGRFFSDQSRTDLMQSHALIVENNLGSNIYLKISRHVEDSGSFRTPYTYRRWRERRISHSNVTEQAPRLTRKHPLSTATLLGA